MKFSQITEVQILCEVLTNTEAYTGRNENFFSSGEYAEIEARSKLLAAVNHARPGGRGAKFSTCYNRQFRGEVSELALQKIINKDNQLVTRHDPYTNGEYHYDGVMLGNFKLEYKCLQMMNTNISWSKLEKVEHMLDHLDDIDAIIITKWSKAANFFIPWYILNPKTVIARMMPSKYEGLLYTHKTGVPGQDFILLNNVYDDDFFKAFAKTDENLEEPDEVIATLDELQTAAELAEIYEGLEKADLDIVNHTESFS